MDMIAHQAVTVDLKTALNAVVPQQCDVLGPVEIIGKHNASFPTSLRHVVWNIWNDYSSQSGH
jgi:hypothetical protein